MLLFSSCVVLATNGTRPRWDRLRAGWLAEYKIPVYRQRVVRVQCNGKQVTALAFADRSEVAVHAIFTTRGDIYHNALGESLGVRLGPEGDIIVDYSQRTSVPGVYAAGCVTPANCQMV